MAQCVTFHSGTVVSLGWRSWWCEFSPIKTGQGWIVEVELKGEHAGWHLCKAMRATEIEWQDMGFSPGDRRAYLDTITEAGRDAWLTFIIQHLSKTGQLNRDHELTAYSSFGLAYGD